MSTSSQLAADWAVVSGEAGNVAAGMGKVSDESIHNRIAYSNEYDRDVARHRLEQSEREIAEHHHHIRRECEQLGDDRAHLIGPGGPPAHFDAGAAALHPLELFEPPQERGEIALAQLAPSSSHQHTDAPHPFALLCARRKRPSCRRTAEQRDELAPFHSMTSSARQ